VRKTRLLFELAKDRLLVSEQISQETTIEFLCHAESSLLLWPENAGCQSVHQLCHICLIRTCKLNKARKVCHKRIESGNIRKPQLPQSRLYD
jgi:hypothetical protein